MAALDPDQAKLLGLDRIGYRTLIRWGNRRRRIGLLGCADDWWLRPGGGRPSVTEVVREAIYAVHGETLHRSRMSMRTQERLIHQYVRELHGAEMTASIPSYPTLQRVWLDWFGSGVGRQRYGVRRSGVGALTVALDVYTHR